MIAKQISWEAACRWLQYEAELRVNVVRLAAIGLFYIVHLLHHTAATGKAPILAALGLDSGVSLNESTHAAITCIVLAWVMVGVLIHHMLRGRVFPRWLMYGSTAGDLLFLTAMVVLTTGPGSPLIVGYFLVVIMSGLRFDLTLVRWTTACAVLSYLIVLGCTKWPMGLSKFNALPTVPRYQQLMMILALAVAGILVGQCVRQARSLSRQQFTETNNEVQS